MNETDIYPDDLTLDPDEGYQEPTATEPPKDPLPEYATKEDLRELARMIAESVKPQAPAHEPVNPYAANDDEDDYGLTKGEFKRYMQELTGVLNQNVGQQIAPFAVENAVRVVGSDLDADAQSYIRQRLAKFDGNTINAILRDPDQVELLQDAARGYVAKKGGGARPEPSDTQGLQANSQVQREWQEFASAFGNLLPKGQKELAEYKRRWIKERSND